MDIWKALMDGRICPYLSARTISAFARGVIDLLFLALLIYLVLGLFPGQTGKDLQKGYLAILRFMVRLVGSAIRGVWRAIVRSIKAVFGTHGEQKK